jgi:ankyrin repeat protein
MHAPILAFLLLIDFGQNVQPLFKQHCTGCHGPSQQMGGFRLDQRRYALPNRVGANGARIVPGKSEASRLYQKLAGTAPGARMPPTGPLTSDEIQIIKTWIDEGAEWPDALSGDAPDSQAAASTPSLMHAVLYENSAAVRRLLDGGADPNAKNAAGATALIWATDDAEKTRLLLQHGGDPNILSYDGRTALMIAAGQAGSAPVVKLLLEHGAKASERSPIGGVTPLGEAARISDEAVIRLLLDHGANPKDAGAALLVGPLRSNCSKCLDMLIPSVESRQLNDALPVAGQTVFSEDPATLKVLLDHGADVNARDGNGRTALMWTAYSDLAPVEVVRMLISHGADVNTRNQLGESPLGFASARGHTPVVDLLAGAGAKVDTAASAAVPRRAAPAAPASIRDAIQRSIPLLQRSGATFFEKAGCLSCHNNSLTAVTMASLRKKGFAVNDQIVRDQSRIAASYVESWRDRVLQGIAIPGGNDTASYILFGMAGENDPATPATDAVARYLKLRQMADGHWLIAGNRPPIESSDIEVTAVSLRAIQAYAPKAQRSEYERSVRLATGWLAQAQPKTNEERVFQILGLTWGSSSKDVLGKKARELIAQQRPDGGWSQLPSLDSDAYATGQALVALRDAGMLRLDNPAYQRGVQYLLNSQFEDGSWYVRSRVVKVQPFFESGFPYGGDQWISAAATNWAVMALAAAVR